MPKSKNVRDDSELGRLIEDTALNRAFQLAHSIYRFRTQDRQTALQIVWEALKGVSVRLVAQREADRHDPQKPSKVRWNTLQWFQILLYYKSEVYERPQEAAAAKNSLTQEDMIIRYIKHLILTTSRRNSFHLTLGLTRLLYGYETSEVMSIYDLIFQDPDTSTKKADAYYRGRKNRMIEELARRFDGLIQIVHGTRGGKRFQPQPDSFQFSKLVEEYLTRFTPWETSCALPTPLDTWVAVHALKGNQAGQIHSLIHPDCFTQIVGALKLDPPEKRLTLPLFFLSKRKGEAGTPPDDGDAPSQPLTEDEASSIREKVREEERRRKKFTPQSLRILADGREQARLELTQSSHVRLEITDDVGLIEVVGVRGDDELLLATHVLMREEDALSEDQAEEYLLTLESGHKISLSVSPMAGEASSLSVEIRYQETAPVGLSWWQRFSPRLSNFTALKNWRAAPWLSTQSALALAALILTALILYIVMSNRPHPPEEIAQGGRPTPTVPAIQALTPTPTPPVNIGPERTPSPARQRPTNANDTSQPGITRAPNERAIKSLRSIERLYVGLEGDDAFGRELRRKLIEKLQGLNQFAIAGSKEEADTALAGVVRAEGKRKDGSTGQEIEIGSAAIELVNIYGEVIWRTGRLKGTADEVASQLINKLRDALRAEPIAVKP